MEEQWNQRKDRFAFEGQADVAGLNRYLAHTFEWMFIGLLVTFFLGWQLEELGIVYKLFAIPSMSTLLLVAELIVVLVLAGRIHKQSVAVTRVLFVLYAVINGVVFSYYFALFRMTELMLIFGLTALFFGAFALYGFVAKTDLCRLRPLLIGGLIFLVIAGVLSMFLNLSGMERIICMVGIVVFLCFTAYDTQKIKENYVYYQQNPEMLKKASIYSALQLYLDFINLFLYLLRFFASKKD